MSPNQRKKALDWGPPRVRSSGLKSGPFKGQPCQLRSKGPSLPLTIGGRVGWITEDMDWRWA